MIEAYHEAGHCVAAIRLGLKVSYITSNICELTLVPWDNFDNFLVAASAGSVSASLCNPALSKTISPGDFELVRSFWTKLDDPLASKMTPALWQARYALAQDKAEAILRKYWSQVEALARELSYRGRLTGEQAVKIIQQTEVIR